MDIYFPFQPLLGGSIQGSEPASLMSCSGVSLGDSPGGILLKVPADSTPGGLLRCSNNPCGPCGAHGFTVRSGDRVPRCFRGQPSSSPRSGSVPPNMTFKGDCPTLLVRCVRSVKKTLSDGSEDAGRLGPDDASTISRLRSLVMPKGGVGGEQSCDFARFELLESSL